MKDNIILDIGVDIMRVNGVIGLFKQLQKLIFMQLFFIFFKMSFNDEIGVGMVLVEKGDFGKCMDDKQKKDNKLNVGYRFGKWKVLYEWWRKIFDYCFVFGMVGILFMILEIEFIMVKVYVKVSMILLGLFYSVFLFDVVVCFDFV